MEKLNRKSVTVYCGASMGNNEIYERTAKEIGAWLGKSGHTLVYGAGDSGLMGTVANAVIDNGGDVVGIIPHFLSDFEPVNQRLTELIYVDDMSERKKLLFSRGDCYIALPGGSGTLEEISEVISWSKIGQNDNPCVLLNINGFYDNLERQYDMMVREGFLKKEERDYILFTDSLEEAIEFINNYDISA